MTTCIYQKTNSFGLTDIWSLEMRIADGAWIIKKNGIAWTERPSKKEAELFINNIK
jgi:hypothetical protein